MRVEPLPGWARVIAVAMVAAVAVLLLAAIRDVARRDDRVPTELVDAILAGPSTLSVGVSSCNKQPTPEVTDEEQVVTVTAYAARRDPSGDDCLDGVTVRLKESLGDRRVADGSSGDDVTVTDES